MSVRSIASRIVLAVIATAVAIACLTSIELAAAVGVLTLVFVVADMLVYRAKPRTARATGSTFVVDLTSRRRP